MQKWRAKTWCLVLMLPLGVLGMAQPNTLTVFAASSLTDAFTEIGKAFESKTNTRVVFQFAGSQTLRSQLENGAKADVFASANNAQFEPLQKAGLLLGGATFARNRLVVIVPKKAVSAKDAGRVKTLADLARPGVRVVVADKTVPAGQYTRAMLEAIGKAGIYGTDYAARVLQNVVSEESNVRQVALKVQLGEADAGVVYTSDVTPKLAPQVIQLAVPARFNQIASYPMGVLQASTNLEAAQGFVAFVRGTEGQAVLKKWGFLAPR